MMFPIEPWLVRVPAIFEPVTEEVLGCLGARSVTRLGQDYYWIHTSRAEAIHDSEFAKFVRWNLPVEHSWPCNAKKMDGFIEKAAQTLRRKFMGRQPQGVFVGQLNPGAPDKYYKGLASNLRGRTLQLFGELAAGMVEDQDAGEASLFALVGREGLFAGMQSPRLCNGFYPGGSLFIDRDAPEAISRAGAKIAEALHYLRLHRGPLADGSHWLELGASPGGMTDELLRRRQRVTAIDRAPLDKRLAGAEGLDAVVADAASYQPGEGIQFDAILSDLNGPPEDSMAHVTRLSVTLRSRGLVIFTLKLPRVETLEEPCRVFRDMVGTARRAGLHLFAETHLTGNRHEFTLFFEKH